MDRDYLILRMHEVFMLNDILKITFSNDSLYHYILMQE